MAKQFVKEKSRKIPVVGSYDVIVAGGGVAGVSAALAAARNGAKTLLLERTYMLGGLATAGLVTIYLPIDDGYGRQVCYGIAEELLRLSVQHGNEPADKNSPRDASCWLNADGDFYERIKHRYEVEFNANVFAILCEQLLIDNDVDILYGATVTSAIVKKNKIEAVIIEGKSGREAYLGKNFIDASGDADLAKVAGAETAEFQQGNILAAWYFSHEKDQYILNLLGFCDIPDKYKTKEQLENKGTRYRGLETKELSDMMIASHATTLQHFLKVGDVSGEHAIGQMASIPQIRMTRRIEGKTVLDETPFTHFEDSVCLIPNWRKRGPVFETPYSSLISKNIVNLAACGRCISVTDTMWEATRVIPCCAATGEAVGTAAAMFDTFHSADVPALQKQMQKQGVKVFLDEMEPVRPDAEDLYKEWEQECIRRWKEKQKAKKG